MIKIGVNSFKFDEYPIKIVEDTKTLIKKGYVAAEFADIIPNLKVSKDHVPLHMLAVSDFEYYGPNKNGDAFPEEANVNYGNTFTKHAHVFRNHKHQDETKNEGKVLADIHNKKAHRIELIAEVDRHKWANELNDIANEIMPGVSMSCRINADICNICKHASESRSQYCNHLLLHMNEILDDGRQVCALNPTPDFFDISRVDTPADRCAYVLGRIDTGNIKSASYDFIDKAMLYKLAHIYKEIPSLVDKLSPAVSDLADINPEELIDIPKEDISGILGACREANVILPFNAFVSLVLKGNKSNSDFNFHDYLDEDIFNDNPYMGSFAPIKHSSRIILRKLITNFSNDPDKIQSRVTLGIIRDGKPILHITKKGASSICNEGIEYVKYLVGNMDITNSLDCELLVLQNLKE